MGLVAFAGVEARLRSCVADVLIDVADASSIRGPRKATEIASLR